MNHPLKILIAEDDADDIELFEGAMKEIYPDIQLTGFENGQTFLSYLSNGHVPSPDLIFLDINMPMIDGKTCLKELRNNIQFHRIPIIMITTSANKEDIMDTFYAGASRYITKPPYFNDLVNMFSQIFDQADQGKLFKADLLNFVMKPTVINAGNGGQYPRTA